MTPEEKAKKYGVPLIPKRELLPQRAMPSTPNPVIAICGKCGMKLYQVMGYCCPNANCPCGMGPVIC